MSVFLYFIEGQDKVAKPERLKEIGLDDVMRGITPTCCGCQRGPGDKGAGGLVFAAPPADGSAVKIGYYPSEQTWQKSVNGKYWLGWFTDQPPMPKALARSEQIAGHYIRLGDGNEWLVPEARVFDQGTNLPEALVLGAKGEVVRQPLQRFAQMSADAERIWLQLRAELRHVEAGSRDDSAAPEAVRDYEPLSDAECFDIAVRALQFNYRIGPQEVSALTLLDTASSELLNGTLVGMETLRKFRLLQQKKSEQVVDSLIQPATDTSDGDRA